MWRVKHKIYKVLPKIAYNTITLKNHEIIKQNFDPFLHCTYLIPWKKEAGIEAKATLGVERW